MTTNPRCTVNPTAVSRQIFAPAISALPPSVAVTVHVLIRGDLLDERSMVAMGVGLRSESKDSGLPPNPTVTMAACARVILGTIEQKSAEAIVMRRSDGEPLHEGLNLVARRSLSALRIGDDPEWVSWIRASYLVVPEKSILRGGNRELLALWRDDFGRFVG